MIYSTSKCPSCGKIIRRQTNPVHKIGNPFEHCRHCGNIYINSYKEEWITKSPIKRFFFFLQIYVWARAFLMPLLLIGIPTVIFDSNVSFEIIKIIWVMLSIVWLIVGYFVHKNANKKDIEESLLRTQDPEYMNLLKKTGYKIYPVVNHVPSNSTQTHHTSNICFSNSPSSVTHICLSNSDDNHPEKDAMCNMAIQNSDKSSSSPQTESSTTVKKGFSIIDLAGAMAEICLNELMDIMEICENSSIPYNEKKLIVSTFAYFYKVWVFNFGKLTVKQAELLEEIYRDKFSLFNRKYYEDEPFKEVINNELLLAEKLSQVDKRVRNSYQANNYTFVDDGISDEFILEFIDKQELMNIIKPEIAIKILKNWVSKATLASKEIDITNS